MDQLKTVACIFLFVIYGPSFVLQAVGFFSPYWVSMDSCDTVGLFYRCCTQSSAGCSFDGKDTYLNRTVLALEATSLSLLMLLVTSMLCAICCRKVRDSLISHGCFHFHLFLYAAAGALNGWGCFMLAEDYSWNMHWGFYVCLSAFGYMFFVTRYCYLLQKSARNNYNNQVQISQSGYDAIRQEPNSQYESQDCVICH